MTAQPLLQVDALAAGYFGMPVVRGLSLTVGAGEVVALLGPNGAGKSTTLRAISRLQPAMAGTIRFRDEDITSLKPQAVARKGLVHMSDRRGIFHGLSVEEHFRLGDGGKSLDLGTAFAYFPALEPLRHRRAGLLSGGEQQMLGLARALARRPSVLIVDELSLGLAPVIVEQLLPVVRRYATDSQAGVLLVEQHIHLALEIGDRGLVLSHGDLVLEESAEAMRADRQLIMSSYLGEGPQSGKRSAAAG
ncbi:ABC transporter ATP-binding protein [Streptomyces cylindrosporus]|uniref:ABC transporter ATP-binding protein n=1 Tax=Streptomyces cylindrosporus TaxID=2927583 RepID=A0ABS9Y0P6_9ACTN|nr:ABC transporter ATP-binding protein [Streptomyces cylindrosporus]MCI3270759.1 ABC transporter ATP-binding protein [Streptomyces cylindrosporus]